jgi:hypothetical protein
MVQGLFAPAEAGYAGGANRVRLFEGRLVPSANHPHLNPKLLIALEVWLVSKVYTHAFHVPWYGTTTWKDPRVFSFR